MVTFGDDASQAPEAPEVQAMAALGNERHRRHTYGEDVARHLDRGRVEVEVDTEGRIQAAHERDTPPAGLATNVGRPIPRRRARSIGYPEEGTHTRCDV